MAKLRRTNNKMDLTKTLIIYGELKVREKEINKRIKEIVNIYYDDEIDKQDIQLFRYFNFNKQDLEEREEPFTLEQWAREFNEEIDPETYELFDLIKERKIVRYKLGYRKMVITKFAIKLREISIHDETNNDPPTKKI